MTSKQTILTAFKEEFGKCEMADSWDYSELYNFEDLTEFKQIETWLSQTLDTYTKELLERVDQEVIGKPEFDEESEELDIFYEDACEAKTRNELKNEQRQALAKIREEQV